MQQLDKYFYFFFEGLYYCRKQVIPVRLWHFLCVEKMRFWLRQAIVPSDVMMLV